MSTPARPPSAALFAPSDRGRVTPVLAALRAAGVPVADSPAAADPSARVVFFASGRSTSDTPLLTAALNAKDAGTLVGVILDDPGAAVLGSWALPDLIDARSATTDVAAAIIRLLSPPGPPRTQPARPRLFISYTSSDHAFVTRLTAWLVTQGWDWWEYKSGERRRVALHRELGQQISESAAVLFVLSPDWFKSVDCQGEWDAAAGLRKEAEYLVVRKIDSKQIKASNYSGGLLRIDFTADEPASFRLLADRLRQIKAATK